MARDKTQKIFEKYRDEIKTGRLPAGGHLPGTTAMVRETDSSSTTIGHVLRQLEEDGYITRRDGSYPIVNYPHEYEGHQ